MSKYFGRLAAVQIQLKDSPTQGLVSISDDFQGAPVSGPLGLAAAQGRAPDPRAAALSDKLHIKFRVEKDTLGQPNRMDLSVYNLSPDTRGRLKTAGAYVVLRAGYRVDAGNLPILFEGNARTIDHQQDRADRVTRIQCGDGETSYQYGVVNQSWGAGVAKVDIAKYLAQELQAADSNLRIDGFLGRLNPAGAANPSRIIFSNTSFYSGYAVFGSAFTEMKKLLGNAYDLYILDGELVALNAAAASPGDAILLDAAHGLIDSPEHCSPNPGSTVSLLKAKSLLNARLQPAGLVRIESVDKAVTGNYRIQKVTHTGDLAGNDWQSELEMLPL